MDPQSPPPRTPDTNTNPEIERLRREREVPFLEPWPRVRKRLRRDAASLAKMRSEQAPFRLEGA